MEWRISASKSWDRLHTALVEQPQVMIVGSGIRHLKSGYENMDLVQELRPHQGKMPYLL